VLEQLVGALAHRRSGEQASRRERLGGIRHRRKSDLSRSRSRAP
jgi:hypothetical protein